MSDLRSVALAWARAGFCVQPTKPNTKAPAVMKWDHFVRHAGSTAILAPPSPLIVDKWYSEPQTGIGLILGGVSGEAEMFEFEGRAIDEDIFRLFGIQCHDNGAGPIWQRLLGGYVERTPSGGLHFVFRLSDGLAIASTPLARRPSNDAELALKPEQENQVLIETRGEGGFVVVAPSTMPIDRAWRKTNGQAGEVATLTCAERDHLYAVARMFDQVPEYVRKVTTPREKTPGKTSPLDDFRARTDWADILVPEGWTHVCLKRDGRDAWLRPGKTELDGGWGWSATTGNTDGHSDSLYIFSTSTDLPALQGLSKEFVWAHYNTGGDLSEAARSLHRDHGFGDALPPKVTPGQTDPFSDGFDAVAWAAEQATKRDRPKAETPPAGEPAEEAEPAPWWTPIDWKSLFAEEFTQEWIVDGFLPTRRATALYSAPKLGKSLLLLELAVAVANGTEFLGMETTRSTVLYIDHENDPRGDVRDRLESMGYGPTDLEDLKYLSFPVMSPLDTPAGGQMLMQAVAIHQATLLVIDTVSRTIEGEENSNDTWLGYNRYTGVLLKRAGITSVRLDHSGKDETKGQRGGSAKSGDVDAIWQLVGDPEAERFILKLDGGRVRYPTDQIGFTRAKDPLRSIRDDSRQRRSDGAFHKDADMRAKAQHQMLEFLFDRGELTAQQLSELITATKTPGIVREIRKAFQDAGAIAVETVGNSSKFRLTEAGRKIVASNRADAFK